MKTLYELTLQAARAVSQYRKPDISAWRAAIKPVLEAAHQRSIDGDWMESLELTTSELKIDTSWDTVSGFHRDTITLPLAVIKDPNPVRAAELWFLERKIAECRTQIQADEVSLRHKKGSLEQYELKLKNLLSGLGSAE